MRCKRKILCPVTHYSEWGGKSPWWSQSPPLPRNTTRSKLTPWNGLCNDFHRDGTNMAHPRYCGRWGARANVGCDRDCRRLVPDQRGRYDHRLHYRRPHPNPRSRYGSVLCDACSVAATCSAHIVDDIYKTNKVKTVREILAERHAQPGRIRATHGNSPTARTAASLTAGVHNTSLPTAGQTPTPSRGRVLDLRFRARMPATACV